MTDEGTCRSVQLEAIRIRGPIVDDVCGTDRERSIGYKSIDYTRAIHA